MGKGDLKIDENTAVRCSTKELANQVLTLADSLGYKWAYGDSFLSNMRWENFHIFTCYCLHLGKYGAAWDYASNGFKVISAEEFIKLHKDMKQTVEIDVPDNMELVDVKPTFRERKLSYADCVRNLKFNSTCEDLYVPTRGYMGAVFSLFSDLQIKKLEAINKMLVVAKYLNGDWKPDWEDGENKYYIYIVKNEITISSFNRCDLSICYFKTKELASQAIEILGEDTIRLALGNY